MTKFRAEAQVFLRQQLDHVAVAKLYRNKPLTASDLAKLVRILAESGIGRPDEMQRAIDESRGLGRLYASPFTDLRRAGRTRCSSRRSLMS